MIFSLLIPFVEVILQVALDHVRSKDGDKESAPRNVVRVGRRKSDKLDRIFKMILPAVIIAFQMIFWIFALTKSYGDFLATHGQCPKD